MQQHFVPFRSLLPALAGSAMLFPATILAQDGQTVDSDAGVSGFIALGPALSPEYEGASDYEPVPLIISRIEGYGLGLEIDGLDARLNLRNRPGLQFGPSFTYRPGRDDVRSDAVDRLSEIDDAIELGGFLRYQFVEVLRPQDELELGIEVLADVTGTHEGLTVGFGGGYATFFAERWRFGFDAGVTFASDDYAETYFGIDGADSARSGLSTFDAEGGLKDVVAEVSLGYAISERWGVIGRLEYTRLVGDAADSPVVDDEGSPDQIFAGLAVSFSF
ncbi:MAG TPA: MipA/OmpV family protein [Kiloniellaceae bacterium]|nr:MipA/OmpV family protein [Kiloniellaceae bacterium]